jgi:CARDB protein
VAATLAPFALGGSADAMSKAVVRMTDCRGATNDHAGSVQFQGAMRALDDTHHMSMRFVLQERYGSGRFGAVKAPGLGIWRRSRHGVSRFSYTQTVKGLRAGADYRAVVFFRWVDKYGHRQLSMRKFSAVCHQPGGPPNLVVRRLRVEQEQGEPQWRYAVKIANTGDTAAKTSFGVLLQIGPDPDLALGSEKRVERLEAHSTKGVVFKGPPCTGRVRATVDPEGDIAETSEKDNSLGMECPS